MTSESEALLSFMFTPVDFIAEALDGDIIGWNIPEDAGETYCLGESPTYEDLGVTVSDSSG